MIQNSHLEALGWLSRSESVDSHVTCLSNLADQDRAQSIARLEEALDQARQAKHIEAQTKILTALVSPYRETGKIALAIEVGTIAVSLSESIGAPILKILALCAISHCSATLDDLPNALTFLTEAGKIADEVNSPLAKAEVLLSKGYCYSIFRSYSEDALDCYLTAENDFSHALPPKRRISMLNNISSSLNDCRRYEEALEYIRRAKELIEVDSFEDLEAFLLGNEAVAKSLTCPFEDVMEIAQRSEHLFEKVGRTIYIPSTMAELGEAYLFAGELELARICLERGKTQSAEIVSQPFLKGIHRSLAQVYEGLQLFEESNSELKEVLRLTDQTLRKDIDHCVRHAVLKQEMEWTKREANLLRLSRDNAEGANRLKSEFLANMSHEIRTPMNGVLGLTSLLIETPLEPQQLEYVRLIRSSGESLLQVINDILDVSRIEAGKFSIDNSNYNLPSLLWELTELMRGRAQEKGLRMVTDIPPGVPDDLVGDPLRIRQILLNLVGNAIKFTASGEIRIEVGVRDKTLLIAVQDSGIGIPPEVQEMVFESFTQADRTTHRQYGGTGLGLTICKQLTTLMGGSIHLESHPGQGSRFWIELPLCLADESAPTSLAASNHLSGIPQDWPLHSLHVLLADDDPINRKVAQKLLERLGATVEVVVNGREAVDRVLLSHYDVILMDCQMPVMDGYEATREIRAREKDSEVRRPIVALTANAMQGDRQTCLESGMDDYLTKPINPRELVKVFHPWIALTQRLAA
jgi:signal transduction histidine kinase/CheY-like chemotaxis protein